MRAMKLAVLFALLGFGERATAAGSVTPSEPEGVWTSIETEARPTFEQRPFAFVVDPSTPGPGAVVLAYTVGVGSGVSADRPIPVVLQAAGMSNELFLGYGVTSWFEPIAQVTATASNGTTVTSALLGMKFQLTAPASPWRAAVLGGALHEGESGAYGTWLRACGSWEAGPMLIEANGYLEHVFLSGRDSLDYAVMGGASFRLAGWFRAGAEYVGQDLEEMGASGAEGGARQGVGPNVAVDLDRGRYQVVATTLLGVGAFSPTAVVRLGLLGTF